MIIYQVKDLNGEEGSEGGYKEYEFCIYKFSRTADDKIYVNFGKGIVGITRNNYSVYKDELNLVTVVS